MRVLFLVNARSGKRRDHAVAELLQRHCTDWTYDIIACQRKEDLDGIIDEAERGGIDVVYAVGGDGTVHETAKRLVHRTPALGILPTGSGNGFARHIGLPMELEPALLSCRPGSVVTVDTAEVEGARFLGVMGIGFDAMVAHRFASSTVRGMRTYVEEGLRAYAGLRDEEYTIEVDGEKRTLSASIVAIANSSQYGNNARIAPLASLQDGLLDVVIISANRLTAPLKLGRLFLGSIHRASGVTSLTGRDIRITRPAAGPGHLDGEPVELPRELRVRIVPDSLRLLVPARTSKL